MGKSAKESITFNKTDFQSLVNGVFQSEGHWGGYLTSIDSVKFRPL